MLQVAFQDRELASIPSRVGHALTDASGLFLSVDDNFRNIIEMPISELQAVRILDITYREDRAAYAANLQQLLQTGQPFRIRKRYVRPSGTLVWIEDHVSLFKDGSGPQRLIASTHLLPRGEMQGPTGRMLLRSDDLAPHLRVAIRDSIVEALERAASRGDFKPAEGVVSAAGLDALVRIANRLMEAHDATALDCDPVTKKMIQAVLLHVGLRIAEDADPMDFNSDIH